MNNIPFPQADDLDKVILFVNKIFQGNTRTEIMITLSITSRQIDYYGNAAVFLNLLEREKKQFFINSQGILFCESNKISQKNKMISILSKHQIFSKFIKDEDNIYIILKDEYLATFSDATIKRRAQTIYSWVKWFKKHNI